MALLLRTDEIQSLLDMRKAIELTESALAEHGRGRTYTHPPYHLLVEGGALRVVSGALLDSGRMGLRSGPGWGLTPASGNRTHLALLYGTDGELLSIMGYPFSALRVGATAAVSVRHLARPDAQRVGLIGSGNLALIVLKGVTAVCDVREISVFSRDAENRRRFCNGASRELGLPVRAVDSGEGAVAGMDIVLTVTNSREPVFSADWLEPGTHVSSLGPISETPVEAFLKADRIVVTNIEHEQNYFVRTPPLPLVELVDAKRLAWEDVVELGSIIVQTQIGRRAAADVTVFHESQGGIGDIAFAAWANDEARRLGLGVESSF